MGMFSGADQALAGGNTAGSVPGLPVHLHCYETSSLVHPQAEKGEGEEPRFLTGALPEEIAGKW